MKKKCSYVSQPILFSLQTPDQPFEENRYTRIQKRTAA